MSDNQSENESVWRVKSASGATAKAYAVTTAPMPDCRTCQRFLIHRWGTGECLSVGICIDAGMYQPLVPLRLWRKSK